MNRYFEEISKNNCLPLFPTNENKETKIYKQPCRKSRELIRLMAKSAGDYDERLMKIKFNSDDELPLNKTIEIPIMIIVVRDSFHENKKYYSQVFLDECLYKS